MKPVQQLSPRWNSKLATQDSSGKYSVQNVAAFVLIQSLQRQRIARRQYKTILKRTYIVQEILSTERAYVDSLRAVVEKYAKPLAERIAKGNPILLDKDMKVIFFQFHEILICNINLLVALEERLKHWSNWQLIGDIFLKMSKSFEAYTSFVNNYNLATSTLRKMEQNNPAFAQFSSEVSSVTKLKLLDYMIMPVQRIPRYELLLSQVLSHTKSEHPDFANLKLAVLEIKRVADFINEKKRQAEARAKVAEIETKMAGDFQSLVTDTRLFIRDGDIVASLDGTREIRRLFLFNDALLCASKLNSATTAVRQVVNKVLQTSKLEYQFDWIVPLLNLSAIVPNEKPVKEANYIDQNTIMKEISKL